MIGSGEAESRAVAGAVKGAVGQVRLNAAVNIAGLLIDIDRADGMDCRQYFMCWHLTRMLRPSLTEMVPPAVVRSVVSEIRRRHASLPPTEDKERGCFTVVWQHRHHRPRAARRAQLGS